MRLSTVSLHAAMKKRRVETFFGLVSTPAEAAKLVD
jgi:hypothetical protein